MSLKQKISILSANYNNGEFLDDFFESINSQTYKNFELVIVDDSSTDNSCEIIQSWCDKSFFDIKFIKLDINHGFANALNIGLKHCDGDYIARLDPDDTMSVTRLERQLKFLCDNPNIHIVGSNALYFQTSPISPVGHSNFLTNTEWIESKYRAAEYGMMHGTLLLRRAVFNNVSYFQDEVPAEDFALISRMIHAGYKTKNIKDILTNVRVHNGSVSNNLPLTTISKVFILRRDIFGIDFTIYEMLSKYFHFHFYRKFLRSTGFLSRYFFLFLSGVFAPFKVFKIILSKIKAD
ncbi:Undecaprenyl-phosphate 4-deoxy-4-formamido-L-arabinose transferase [Shewanella hafniensis]|nr:Undecaprenyl-phosphate 4-deoxy-4-formamido-L-arabinose transferase [Shewanella hafniensis]